MTLGNVGLYRIEYRIEPCYSSRLWCSWYSKDWWVFFVPKHGFSCTAILQEWSSLILESIWNGMGRSKFEFGWDKLLFFFMEDSIAVLHYYSITSLVYLWIPIFMFSQYGFVTLIANVVPTVGTTDFTLIASQCRLSLWISTVHVEQLTVVECICDICCDMLTYMSNIVLIPLLLSYLLTLLCNMLLYYM